MTRTLIGYICSTSSQGLGVFCFSPSEIFSFSLLTPITMHSISSSSFSISDGCDILPQLKSDICRSPSSPPRSTNTPKSAIFFTIPLRSWPTSISSRICSLLSRLCSSMSLRRDTTIFLPSTSILRILHLISLPMNLLMSPGFRISTCDAGRNTGTPISTSRPPLIRRITLPVTISSSFFVLIICSQPRMRSALRFDSGIRPPSVSKSSRRTSISLSGSISSGLSNSLTSTTPSLFRPTSIITSLPICDTILPFRIVPGSRESTLASSTFSRYLLSSSVNISLTCLSRFSHVNPNLLIIFLSTINYFSPVQSFLHLSAPHIYAVRLTTNKKLRLIKKLLIGPRSRHIFQSLFIKSPV